MRTGALNRQLAFSVGCLYELALLVLAVLWSWFFHRPTFPTFKWSLSAFLVGALAAIPPFAFFAWTLRSRIQVFSRHKQLMESLLRPLFGKWSLLELALISLVAGFSEEALFRGAIQGSLAGSVGLVASLVLASVAFGASHLITWTYAIIATAIGAYLGWLWIWSGNLLTPMVTHAVYDFAALLYFLRVYQE
jgi:uncharacterized protein